jgi:AraC-like DNA-binding protein
VSRPILEAFVAGPGWACFDPELGYLLRDSAIAWGVDGSLAVETFDDDGGREALRYPGRRPRINSYGDELTEGMQVNDGETWQEYLSARLREPVGNYGVGGYGVYQSYRRMIREESARPAAPVIVLGVTGPAMVRSVTRSHWVTTATLQWRDLGSGRPVFHGNPWPSLEMDLEAGELVERENPLRTPDSLLAMADPEWMVHAFHDDLASRLLGFSRGFVADVDRRATERLAEILGTRVAWDDPRTEADRVLNLYGQTATIAVLDRTADFVASRGGRLLVVLDFTAGPPGDGSTRDDDRVLAHLTAGGFAVVDVNDAHRREAATSLLSWEEYLARYVVAGNPDSVLHYNPRGNHFFAYAVKDGLIGLLDRKPAPYRARWARAVATRDRTAVGQPDLAGRDAWIAPVLRELGARFADPWDADSLTRLARRSRSAFYRDFLAVMKVSPMEYVKRLRLDEAARLFVTGDATIAAVAGHIGFGSPFHLSREFTRRFGVSPSEYRRSAREDLARQA